jgi:hypothetical protein
VSMSRVSCRDHEPSVSRLQGLVSRVQGLGKGKRETGIRERENDLGRV